MIKLRCLDKEGLRSYLDDLRPRLLTLRLRVKGLHLRWAIPLWAVEEIVLFALKLAPLLPVLARYTPGYARRNPSPDFGEFDIAGFLIGLLSEEGRNTLRLPPDRAFVVVETRDALIEIGQL